MKYKVGDKVRIISFEYFDKYKGIDGCLVCGSYIMNNEKSTFCGQVVTISSVGTDCYAIEEDNGLWNWSDEMIEGLVEEETKNNNNMEEKETLLGWVKESDTLRLVPHKDYEIKHDEDNFYLVKKKKEYPKTYEECLKVLGYDDRETYCTFHTIADERLFEALYRLKVCRDAYWKIAGEEMGLGKDLSWVPDWMCVDPLYAILYRYHYICKAEVYGGTSCILAFPTKEMRDVFYENFKELINECKELL